MANLISFIKRTAVNFATDIKEGRFGCSSSLKTDEEGMKVIISQTNEIAFGIRYEISQILGIANDEEYEKAVDGRQITIECEKKNDVYQIVFKIQYRAEAKKYAKKMDGKMWEACGYCETLLQPHLLKRCGGCKKIRYCSPECAKEDWNKGGHKKKCDKNHTKKAE